MKPVAALLVFMRRERRAVLLLAVALVALGALESVIEAAFAFYHGDEKAGWDEAGVAVVWSLLAWGVYKQPAKWGYRVGVFGLVVLGLLVVVGVPVIWLAMVRRADDFPGKGLLDARWWEWARGIVIFLCYVGVALAFRSLRWLYPTTQVPPSPAEATGAPADMAGGAGR